MKRFFISIIFLVVITTACLFLVDHLNQNTISIQDEISRIQDAVEKDDETAADDAMKKLISHWEDEKYLFHALAGSSYCDPFESALDRSKVWLKQRQSEELFAELSELNSRIQQLWDTQAIHPKNFF